MDGDGEEQALLWKKSLTRCVSRVDDELCSFRTCLRWRCVDQSDPWRTTLCWFVFLDLAFEAPTLSHFILRFLFLDKLCNESEKVRQMYSHQLNSSFRLLSCFVLPCFVVEISYRAWWYAYETAKIPFIWNHYVSDTISCVLELSSWVYRASIFFLACVLFQLISHLQIRGLQDFTSLQAESDPMWNPSRAYVNNFESQVIDIKPSSFHR